MQISQETGLDVQHTLGKGSFGTVHYCTHKNSKDAYAVKIFQKCDYSKTKLQYFRKEADILQSLDHPNIVKFHSFKQTQDSIYLIMEYIPGGTLRQYITGRRKSGNKFTDEEVAVAIKAILSGIQYLHKANIIHRDLKPDNIILSAAGDLTSLKIVDFGLSAQTDSTYSRNVKAQCGTLLYMAPQILHSPSYSKAVDIWSCAIIMYEMYTGSHPLHKQGMKNQQFKQGLKNCKFPELQNPLAQNFVSKLSIVSPTERYSVNQALNHPWITRKKQDQIPLSVNQSIRSFITTHLIADTLKFFTGIRKKINQKQQEHLIPLEYKQKVDSFEIYHNQQKQRSNSMKKINRKSKQVFIKIRQIINNKGVDFDGKQSHIEYQQIPSPIVRKHQRLYLKLFDKKKDEISNRSIISLNECQSPLTLQSNRSALVQSQSKEKSPSSKFQRATQFCSMKSTINVYNTFQLQLPILKSPQKKQKNFRKMNSLRQERKQKPEDFNFKHYQNKKRVSFDNRTQIIRSSKSKRPSVQNESESPKRSTIQIIKSSSKGFKGSPKKPMIFGSGKIYK